MEEIYLIPKKLEPFNIKKKQIYLKDIYCIYPKKNKIENICIRKYEEDPDKYDVIHMGEIIEKIKEYSPSVHINFLRTDDIIIHFADDKKDRSKYIRVFLVSIVVLMGSIMGIMNFHADVNMDRSQLRIVDSLTDDGKENLKYFQIPYSIGIGLGVALFFNKFIPTYSKGEASPLDLRLKSLSKEIENDLINKR